ncbi:MAG TPA: hypothetical protein VGJ84_02050 [Polyangiaceae bacterium]|jgi:hypothetical protein
MEKRFYSMVSGAVLLLAGCGGGAQSAPAPETPTKAGATGEPGAPNIPWKDKSFEQRKEYMGLYVLPQMKKLFREYDPGSFAEFKCQTCHGEDFEKVHFKMPNHLFALLASDPIKAAMDRDPKIAKFMMENVVPTMSKLLSQQPISPDNPTGFGCFNCHQKG